MGLQVDEAIDNLNADTFQITRKLDVRFFIKPGLQLDQCRNRFAGFGRFNQGTDNRRFI